MTFWGILLDLSQIGCYDEYLMSKTSIWLEIALEIMQDMQCPICYAVDLEDDPLPDWQPVKFFKRTSHM